MSAYYMCSKRVYYLVPLTKLLCDGDNPLTTAYDNHPCVLKFPMEIST